MQRITKNRVCVSTRCGLRRLSVAKIKYSDYNGFGGVKIIIMIPAIFICRPYGTLEIIGNGVATNILSLAGHFSGFLPKIHYDVIFQNNIPELFDLVGLIIMIPWINKEIFWHGWPFRPRRALRARGFFAFQA